MGFRIYLHVTRMCTEVYRLGHHTDSKTGFWDFRTHGVLRDWGMLLPLPHLKVNAGCHVKISEGQNSSILAQKIGNVFHNQTTLVRNSLENVFSTSIGICRNRDFTVLNSCNSLNFKSKNDLKRQLFWSQDNSMEYFGKVMCTLLRLFSSCYFSKSLKNSLCKGLWFQTANW